MRIDDNFYIRRDSSISFCLVHESKKVTTSLTKDIGGIKETVTYHSSIANCLKSYARQVINHSNTIDEILSNIQRLDDKIDSLQLKFTDAPKAESV